jgi:hypothetical protein
MAQKPQQGEVGEDFTLEHGLKVEFDEGLVAEA